MTEPTIPGPPRTTPMTPMQEAREAVERESKGRPPSPPLTPEQERAMMIVFDGIKLSKSTTRPPAVDNAPATPHRADVHGHGFQFYWTCSCGKSGKPTTDGRASAGRDRHLTAERRKAR